MATVNPLLDTLCDRFAIWTCGERPARLSTGVPTGYAAFDTALPDAGWPASALTELLVDSAGIGELSLLFPALARLSATTGVLLVCPPFLPYAPAWVAADVDLRRLLVIAQCAARDALACAEWALRSGACGAVVVWESGLVDASTRSLPYLALKRLHLAAGRGNAMAILFRSLSRAMQPSPAVLRIKLGSHADRLPDQLPDQLRLTLFKHRGLLGERMLDLPVRPAHLRQEILYPPMPPAWSPLAPAIVAGAQPHPNAWME